MITERFPDPRGLDSSAKAYGFYVRVSGENRELLKKSHEIAKERFGDRLSNAKLLEAMMRNFTAGDLSQPTHPERAQGYDEHGDMI